MIGRLTGTLAEVRPDLVLIDVGGVGYEVLIPQSTHSRLPEPGSEASLRIYTLVREDVLQLFGFATPEEKTLFEKLLSVSGIGPKLALSILSGLPPYDFVRAVTEKNTALLCTIPGVGKKLAERLALELKDKVSSLVFHSEKRSPSPAHELSSEAQDATAALIGLGYKPPQAEAAVLAAIHAAIPNDTGALVQAALRSLASSR